MPVVDLADVQGLLILRGYTMPVARYLGLTVREPRAARTFLGGLITGDTATVSITTGQPWAAKPQCCVNLGITFPGLAALGVPPVALDSFPAEYAQGAAQRAARVGDVGTSSPEFVDQQVAVHGMSKELLQATLCDAGPMACHWSCHRTPTHPTRRSSPMR
ncbi:MAG: hypothetical protein M3143_08365 [Actinomycetota bacterium]|nr:hypothetical protein [Actinomycetota bacterium]